MMNLPATRTLEATEVGIPDRTVVRRWPAGRWMERRFWFKFLNRHHYIHHVDTECNVNFLLPLGDLLCGTLRTQLSESELSRWPSFEEATHRVFPNLRRDPKLAGVEAGVSHTTIG